MNTESDNLEISILLGAFVELRKATISFVMSASTCVHMEQHGSQWMDIHEILNLNLSRKFSCQNIIIIIIIIGILYEDLCTYLTVSR
jgi:hypothetical protein